MSLSALWTLLTSMFGVASLIGVAALAVAVIVPKWLDWITDLRKWALIVAVCAFGFAAVSAHYFAAGLAAKQAEWDAARDAADAEKKRREAEIAANAADRARRDAADEQAADKAAIGALNEYVKELEARGDAACRLNDDDLRRLRAL